MIQEFIREFSEQSKADSEKVMRDAVTHILATIVGTMGSQVYGYMPVSAPEVKIPVQLYQYL